MCVFSFPFSSAYLNLKKILISIYLFYIEKTKHTDVFARPYVDNTHAPVDPDTQAGDFQRKLELLNNGMTNDRHHRQVQHLGNCKYRLQKSSNQTTAQSKFQFEDIKWIYKDAPVK